jgi:toxin ParE1/3/4
LRGNSSAMRQMTEKRCVRWSPAALDDLNDALQYLSCEAGIEQALSILEKVERKVTSLARHPRRCRIVPELKTLGVTTYRELILSPYRVFFRIDDEVVGIIAMLDGRRDIEECLILRGLAR